MSVGDVVAAVFGDIHPSTFYQYNEAAGNVSTVYSAHIWAEAGEAKKHILFDSNGILVPCTVQP